MRVASGNPEVFIRLLVFFFLTTLGRTILGSTLLVSGLIYGSTSHTVTYQRISLSSYKVYSQQDKGDYLVEDSLAGVWYKASLAQFLDDFGTTLAQQHDAGQQLTLVYDANQQKFNVPQPDGTTTQGSGYQIMSISVLDAQGNTTDIHESLDYKQHRQAYYVNNWQAGEILAGAGLLLLLVTPITAPLITWWNKKHPPKALSEAGLVHLYQKQTRNPWSKRGVSRATNNLKNLTR